MYNIDELTTWVIREPVAMVIACSDSKSVTFSPSNIFRDLSLPMILTLLLSAFKSGCIYDFKDILMHNANIIIKYDLFIRILYMNY